MDRNKSFLSVDFDASELINEELADPISFYYEKVSDSDDLDSEWLLSPKRLLEGRGNQLRLNRIVTTGLPQEGAGGYYSGELLKTPLRQR